MEKVKKPSVAGKFYTADKEELLSQLEAFDKNNPADYNYKSKAVIVPHAGYYYSGQLANNGISCLNKSAKNIIIIAPTHYVPFEGLALTSYEKWSTPIGEITVNQEINKKLKESFSFCQYLDEAFKDEHSAEVQVPFIQKMFPEAQIIPILVGRIDYEKISEVFKLFWDDSETAFVVSSDLSHFYTSSQARKIDNATAEMIETGETEDFRHEQACGSSGVLALLNFAREKNYSMIRVGMYNSGDVTGDESRVVGYGSWLLYEGEKTKFLKDNFSGLMLKICKESIQAGLNKENIKPEYEALPAVFYENGACFVTLEKHGDLRGCIGSIIAHQPLIADLIQNARNAAFSDPRFLPVKAEELNELSIAISLLSAPVKMVFADEKDLLAQIVPFKDGIIIKDGGYQAVYLPSVWEQLPDKELFLKSLKQKAGMRLDHFSKTFEAYRYSAEYVK